MMIQTGGLRPIRIYTLGCFEIVLDGVPLRFVSKAPRKVLAVLKGLLCAGGRGVSQGTLQDALWPESDPGLARRALNTSVYRLRQLLGHKDAVVLSDGWLALDPALCWVDAWVFEQGIGEPCDPNTRRPILRLYGGMFLSEAYYPLAFEPRERLRRKFIQAVLELGNVYESSSEIGAAISLYETALDIDCTPEDVHRALMRCLVLAGKPAAVGAAYQRCRAMLWRHYAISPSPATQSIYREVWPNPEPGSPARTVAATRPTMGPRSALRRNTSSGPNTDITYNTGVIAGISRTERKVQG